jgi:hypothetical protein
MRLRQSDKIFRHGGGNAVKGPSGGLGVVWCGRTKEAIRSVWHRHYLATAAESCIAVAVRCRGVTGGQVC